MKKLTSLTLLLGSLHISSRSWAQDCCAFDSASCALRDHEDVRCSTGTRSIARVNNVFHCPEANQIVFNGDPITFLISLAIATENARVGCQRQVSSACSDAYGDLCGDTDGDGLWDIWEMHGIDGDGDGAPENFLPGAHTERKDLFLEVDCLQRDGNGDGDYTDSTDHSHCPRREALEIVIRAFADAPVLNVDGTSGIQLHIDVGGLFGAGVVVTVPGGGGVVGSYGDFGGGGNVIDEAGYELIGLDTVASLKQSFFDANRRRAYRYALFGHSLGSDDCTSGIAETPGNDLIVSLGGLRPQPNPMDPKPPCWGTDANGFSVGTVEQQAGTLMHEFGHALGRHHGGEQVSNKKPNYLSVMRYGFQMCQVPSSAPGTPRRCDYSFVALPPLDESSLDECAGVDRGLLGFGPVDWNADKVLQGATCAAPNTSNVAADVNGELLCVSKGINSKFDSVPGGDDVASGLAIVPSDNGACETTALGDDVSEIPLRGSEDWNRLQLALALDGDFADGNRAEEVEATPELIEAERRYLSDQTRPEVLVQTSAPSAVLPGAIVTYETRLSNQGRGPALDTTATLLLPDGGGVSADLGVLVLGRSTSVTSTFTVPGDACPMTLTHTAMVEYEDLAAFSYTASGVAASTVLDVVPPHLELIGSGAVTLECGVDAYSELGAVATDSCDAHVPVVVAGDTVQSNRPGTYSVSYSAEDDSGNSSSLNRVVRVADTTPPSLSVTLSPNTLGPPDHKLVQILPAVTVRDACDPSPVVSLVRIASNEPGNGSGDGNTSSDIVVDAQGNIFLRAERSGNGNGRVYTLTFEATDASHNTQSFSTTVTVPKR